MKKKGYTLIELMIVVAIMAILAALIIPACSRITGSDSSGKCEDSTCQE